MTRCPWLPGDPVGDRRIRLADGKETSLDQVRGRGFLLVGVGLDPAAVADAARLRDDLAAALGAEEVGLALVAPETDVPPFVAELDDESGELAAAWEARPGEVFVVRPDGLLLARGPVAGHAGLPAHLRAGGPAAAVPSQAGADAVALPPAEAAREAAWLALSAGLDSVPADDREGVLARLALLLADRVGTDDFLTAVSTAASTR